jgi:hypothetical protein
MPRSEKVSIRLNVDEIHLLLEGLDAYEYWQLGDVLPRNNGMVFLPDDLFGERYWPADEIPSEAQAEAIEAVRACRALADLLTRAATVDV